MSSSTDRYTPGHGAHWAPTLTVTHLDIEQVQLNRIASVHVLIRVEELPPQQQYLALLNILLPQCLGMVEPVHYGNTNRLTDEYRQVYVTATEQHVTDTDADRATSQTTRDSDTEARDSDTEAWDSDTEARDSDTEPRDSPWWRHHSANITLC